MSSMGFDQAEAAANRSLQRILDHLRLPYSEWSADRKEALKQIRDLDPEMDMAVIDIAWCTGEGDDYNAVLLELLDNLNTVFLGANFSYKTDCILDFPESIGDQWDEGYLPPGFGVRAGVNCAAEEGKSYKIQVSLWNCKSMETLFESLLHEMAHIVEMEAAKDIESRYPVACYTVPIFKTSRRHNGFWQRLTENLEVYAGEILRQAVNLNRKEAAIDEYWGFRIMPGYKELSQFFSFKDLQQVRRMLKNILGVQKKQPKRK